jgi:hypothetical protein
VIVRAMKLLLVMCAVHRFRRKKHVTELASSGQVSEETDKREKEMCIGG